MLHNKSKSLRKGSEKSPVRGTLSSEALFDHSNEMKVEAKEDRKRARVRVRAGKSRSILHSRSFFLNVTRPKKSLQVNN
jgi:hypothetical protein